MTVDMSGSPIALTIAIDGPAGSGKSTAARLIAERLDYVYLNSGSMYRAITLLSVQSGVEPSNQIALIELAQNCQIEFVDNGQITLLDGIDVSTQIRTPVIDSQVAAVAKVPGVRKEMVHQQRRIASSGGVVAEGRDTTTVVLPNADLKFYITASVNVRANRRFNELQGKGINCSISQIVQEITDRDLADKSRLNSPLKIDQEAIVIDTSDLTIGEVVSTVLKKTDHFSTN